MHVGLFLDGCLLNVKLGILNLLGFFVHELALHNTCLQILNSDVSVFCISAIV